MSTSQQSVFISPNEDGPLVPFSPPQQTQLTSSSHEEPKILDRRTGPPHAFPEASTSGHFQPQLQNGNENDFPLPKASETKEKTVHHPHEVEAAQHESEDDEEDESSDEEEEEEDEEEEEVIEAEKTPPRRRMRGESSVKINGGFSANQRPQNPFKRRTVNRNSRKMASKVAEEMKKLRILEQKEDALRQPIAKLRKHAARLIRAKYGTFNRPESRRTYGTLAFIKLNLIMHYINSVLLNRLLVKIEDRSVQLALEALVEKWNLNPSSTGVAEAVDLVEKVLTQGSNSNSSILEGSPKNDRSGSPSFGSVNVSSPSAGGQQRRHGIFTQTALFSVWQVIIDPEKSYLRTVFFIFIWSLSTMFAFLALLVNETPEDEAGHSLNDGERAHILLPIVSSLMSLALAVSLVLLNFHISRGLPTQFVRDVVYDNIAMDRRGRFRLSRRQRMMVGGTSKGLRGHRKRNSTIRPHRGSKTSLDLLGDTLKPNNNASKIAVLSKGSSSESVTSSDDDRQKDIQFDMSADDVIPGGAVALEKDQRSPTFLAASGNQRNNTNLQAVASGAGGVVVSGSGVQVGVGAGSISQIQSNKGTPLLPFNQTMNHRQPCVLETVDLVRGCPLLLTCDLTMLAKLAPYIVVHAETGEIISVSDHCVPIISSYLTPGSTPLGTGALSAIDSIIGKAFTAVFSVPPTGPMHSASTPIEIRDPNTGVLLFRANRIGAKLANDFISRDTYYLFVLSSASLAPSSRQQSPAIYMSSVTSPNTMLGNTNVLQGAGENNIQLGAGLTKSISEFSNLELEHAIHVLEYIAKTHPSIGSDLNTLKTTINRSMIGTMEWDPANAADVGVMVIMLRDVPGVESCTAAPSAPPMISGINLGMIRVLVARAVTPHDSAHVTVDREEPSALSIRVEYLKPMNATKLEHMVHDQLPPLKASLVQHGGVAYFTIPCGLPPEPKQAAPSMYGGTGSIYNGTIITNGFGVGIDNTDTHSVAASATLTAFGGLGKPSWTIANFGGGMGQKPALPQLFPKVLERSQHALNESFGTLNTSAKMGPGTRDIQLSVLVFSLNQTFIDQAFTVLGEMGQLVTAVSSAVEFVSVVKERPESFGSVDLVIVDVEARPLLVSSPPVGGVTAGGEVAKAPTADQPSDPPKKVFFEMPTSLVAPLPTSTPNEPSGHDQSNSPMLTNNILPSPMQVLEGLGGGSNLQTPIGNLAQTQAPTPNIELASTVVSTSNNNNNKEEEEAFASLVSAQGIQMVVDVCSAKTSIFFYCLHGEFPASVPLALRLNHELTTNFVESVLMRANLHRLSRLTVANANNFVGAGGGGGGSIINGATNSIVNGSILGGFHGAASQIGNAANINMCMNYTLGRKLGGGGFGDVFEAILAVTGGKVALKRIYMRGNTHQSSMEQLANISREVEIMASLQHPNIVKFIAFSQEDPFHCIFMELCDGADLSKRLAAGSSSPVAPREVTKIIRDIVSAVAYMHGTGVIHRDLKPQNILFRDGVAKVADFGTATRRHQDGAAVAGTMRGTLAYMAPESMLGERYDCSCDVWSLGCILAEILGVELPHVKSLSVHMLTLMYQEMTTADHILVPDEYNLPEHVSTLIERCLHRDLAQRPTAEDILAHPICWDINVAPTIRQQVLALRNNYGGGAKSIDMSIQSDDESGDGSSEGSMRSMVPSLCSTRQTTKSQKGGRSMLM